MTVKNRMLFIQNLPKSQQSMEQNEYYKHLKEKRREYDMKKLFIVLLVFSMMLCSCGKEEIEEGKDCTIVTEVIKGNFGEQYLKEPLKMINVGGELYFDSGLEGETIPRCGTLDGNLDFSVPPGEIPQNDGEANFDVEGYQSITSISKEVNIDGKWLVFRKFENQPENLKEYKYCFYIKGRLNNAAMDHEIVVLTDDKDITFSDVYDPLFSSVYPTKERKSVFRDRLNTDRWGISLSAEDVTSVGMMLNICQFGGEYKGELNTGAWFSLEVTERE